MTGHLEYILKTRQTGVGLHLGQTGSAAVANRVECDVRVICRDCAGYLVLSKQKRKRKRMEKQRETTEL